MTRCRGARKMDRWLELARPTWQDLDVVEILCWGGRAGSRVERAGLRTRPGCRARRGGLRHAAGQPARLEGRRGRRGRGGAVAAAGLPGRGAAGRLGCPARRSPWRAGDSSAPPTNATCSRGRWSCGGLHPARALLLEERQGAEHQPLVQRVPAACPGPATRSRQCPGLAAAARVGFRRAAATAAYRARRPAADRRALVPLAVAVAPAGWRDRRRNPG